MCQRANPPYAYPILSLLPRCHISLGGRTLPLPYSSPHARMRPHAHIPSHTLQPGTHLPSQPQTLPYPAAERSHGFCYLYHATVPRTRTRALVIVRSTTSNHRRLLRVQVFSVCADKLNRTGTQEPTEPSQVRCGQRQARTTRGSACGKGTRASRHALRWGRLASATGVVFRTRKP
jgi:hypothetical protein